MARHSTPTDRPAVERDSRDTDTGNKVFLLVGLIDFIHLHLQQLHNPHDLLLLAMHPAS